MSVSRNTFFLDTPPLTGERLLHEVPVLPCDLSVSGKEVWELSPKVFLRLGEGFLSVEAFTDGVWW